MMSSWGEIHPAPSVLRQYNAPDRPARSAAQQVLQGLTTVCACSYLNNVTHLDLAFTQVANLAALAQVRSSCSAARHMPALSRQLLFAAVPSGLDESQWSCVCVTALMPACTFWECTRCTDRSCGVLCIPFGHTHAACLALLHQGPLRACGRLHA